MMTFLVRSMVVAAMASTVTAPTVFAQGGTATSTPSGGTRFAYINSQKILQDAPGRAEAEAAFDKERGTVQAQLQRMDDSLKAMYADLQRDAPTLDSARRMNREKIFADRRDEYQHRAQDLNAQLQQRQADLARPLMDQMAKVLDEFRAKNGYAMIFDVGTQASVVVSADKSLDITDQVLARLKELGPPKATASTSTPSSVGPMSTPTGVRRP